MQTDLTAYYAKRAVEYEAIYAKPERQSDLKKATAWLLNIFKGRDVLEIACGTGFWTEKMAQTAHSILATDINDSVLEIARNKNYPNRNVRFETADLYRLQPEKSFEALFGGFIWSHIAMQELPAFIRKCHALVSAGGTIVMMDNRYVEGSSTPIFSRDDFGNTYQLRRLQNGEEHLVLKNFPLETDLKKMLDGYGTHFQRIQYQYFWIATWQTGPSL